MDYKYMDVDEGERQYDNIELTESKIVEACYVKSMIRKDNGNPFIEALPYPLHDNEVIRVYSKNLFDYDHLKINSMSNIDRMLAVSMLRQVRFYLPFHDMLEYEFYNSLVNSYRARRIMKDIYMLAFQFM